MLWKISMKFFFEPLASFLSSQIKLLWEDLTLGSSVGWRKDTDYTQTCHSYNFQRFYLHYYFFNILYYCDFSMKVRFMPKRGAARLCRSWKRSC
jgi:hypothetical protein